MNNQQLEDRFNDAMFEVYRRAKSECGYTATRFLNMLNDHGGMATARILLNAQNVSDGYTALWERRRLDLTVEAVILQRQWHALFTDEDRSIATRRLAEYGYDFSESDSNLVA